MILDEIIAVKKKEVAHRKEIRPIRELERAAEHLPPARDFRKALAGRGCAIIAEIKRRSPSKGRLCGDFDPVKMAKTYEANGAAAISVLTDRTFFEGDDAYLQAVKKAASLPVLRKDFTIDSYQVYETRVLGGDALLLIASLFEGKELKALIGLARSLGLSALVEVHSEEEAAKAVAADACIIGINNRDLRTFKTDLGKSLELARVIPADRIVVSESGIETKADIGRLSRAGIHAFLVGEALMRAADAGEKLRELAGK
jgi:indole-3-glycerol phosphate synthase